MKKNTKKILLWLYQKGSSDERWVNIDNLRFIIPDLSSEGFRSLINLLKRKNLISKEKIDGGHQVRLTSHGKDQLEAQFPALTSSFDNWDRSWSVIVFLQAPKSDRQFRYLRKFLLEKRWGQLSRGVYLYPGEVGVQAKELFNKIYSGSILILKSDTFYFGDELSVIKDVFLLSDIYNSYSSVGKEVVRLLSQKNKDKASTNQFKKRICLVFDRLVELIDSDLGLVTVYFPTLQKAEYYLRMIQEVY